MPGHVKKSDGPDPDPSPWLIVSDELKVKLKAKPYDAKKSCWVPDKATGGYDEGLIESADGEKVSVQILGGDVKVFKKDQVGQVNPPKFDCSEDMAGEHLWPFLSTLDEVLQYFFFKELSSYFDFAGPLGMTKQNT